MEPARHTLIRLYPLLLNTSGVVSDGCNGLRNVLFVDVPTSELSYWKWGNGLQNVRGKIDATNFLGYSVSLKYHRNASWVRKRLTSSELLLYLRACFVHTYACTQKGKEAAYKGLVRPILEYSGSVWEPSGVGLQDELENVQNRATRFVTGNYNYETGSMTSQHPEIPMTRNSDCNHQLS